MPEKAAGHSGLLEWFWRSRRLAELREQAGRESAAAERFERRARVASELAARALDPAESFLSSHAEELACELYRESVYWALRALGARRGTGSSAADSPAEVEQLWDAAGDTLAEARLTPERLTELRRRTAHESFVELAELAPEVQATTARDLGRVAEVLLAAATSSSRQIETIWFRRTLHLGAIGLLALAVGLVLAFSDTWREEAADLAAGRDYRTSSAFSGPRCRSPSQSCSESPNYFFHTEDENKPWVEIDLGKPEQVGAVRIENRTDCCQERAVPLLVELSTDRERYRQVARQDEVFDSWRAEFDPVPARYVRVRAARRTLLHLARIRVLPQ